MTKGPLIESLFSPNNENNDEMFIIFVIGNISGCGGYPLLTLNNDNKGLYVIDNGSWKWEKSFIVDSLSMPWKWESRTIYQWGALPIDNGNNERSKLPTDSADAEAAWPQPSRP